jgi:hypothetical protein
MGGFSEGVDRQEDNDNNDVEKQRRSQDLLLSGFMGERFIKCEGVKELLNWIEHEGLLTSLIA